MSSSIGSGEESVPTVVHVRTSWGLPRLAPSPAQIAKSQAGPVICECFQKLSRPCRWEVAIFDGAARAMR